jgi:hypothetical protein
MITLSNNRSFKINWINANTPKIEIDDHSVILTKRDLLNMRSELSQFIEFYSTDFEKKNIDVTLNFGNEND